MFFESFLLNLAVITVLIVALIFDYVTKFFSYWYIRYIPYKTPVPFFGSDYHRVLGLRNTTQEVNNLYSKYKNAKFVGCIKSRIPDLVIRDVDAVQRVLSTDFENFQSRGLDLDKSQDVCLRNNLFYASEENWTLLRECFESLLKGMNSQCDLHDCLSGINGDLNVQHLLTNVLDAIFKEMLAGDSNEAAILTDIRLNIQRRNVSDKLKSYIKNIFPSLYKSFGLMTLQGGQPSNKTLQTLHRSKLMNEVTKTRSILQSQETEKNKKKSSNSDVDFTFSFLASFISEGYIPCHNLITSMLYELARNPQVQKKARETNQNEGSYLEKVINEVLRLHPPYSVITRKCMKTYKFIDNVMIVDRRVTINVPVEAIQRDSKYYNEPEVFKPDRFSKEDSSRHPCAFLPFGTGPRKCIGEKLARQIVRHVTSSILKKYDITPTENTPTELPMADFNFGRVVERDIWLRFTPI